MTHLDIVNRLRTMALEAIFNKLSGGTMLASKRLTLTYLIDWVLIMYVDPCRADSDSSAHIQASASIYHI